MHIQHRLRGRASRAVAWALGFEGRYALRKIQGSFEGSPGPLQHFKLRCSSTLRQCFTRMKIFEKTGVHAPLVIYKEHLRLRATSPQPISIN